MLKIQNLSVEKGGKRILNNLNAVFQKGKTYLLIGANGSGKSTLAQTIMGDSSSVICNGKISYSNNTLNSIPINTRVNLGIYVSWQTPPIIEGISTKQLLRIAKNELNKNKNTTPLSHKEFNDLLDRSCKELEISNNLVNKSLGDNLSGGERKILELLHILILNPQLIILDEVDAGLDVDGKKNLIKLIKSQQKSDKTLIIISHNHTLYKELNIQDVYLMKKGEMILFDHQALIQVNQNGYKRT